MRSYLQGKVKEEFARSLPYIVHPLGDDCRFKRVVEKGSLELRLSDGKRINLVTCIKEQDILLLASDSLHLVGDPGYSAKALVLGYLGAATIGSKLPGQ